MRRTLLTLAVLALLLGTGRANAALVFYANRAAFDAATTDTTTIDFEGIAPPNGFVSYGANGSLTLSGVTFTATNADLFVDSGTYYQYTYGTPYNLGSGDFLLSGNGNRSGLQVTLPGSFTEIAFDLGTFDTPVSVITVTLSSGDVFATSAPYPNHTFVGFTSTNPISSLDITITAGDRRDTLALDNFTFGPAAPVPEPTSLTLLGIGAVSMMGYAWRRRKQAAIASC